MLADHFAARLDGQLASLQAQFDAASSNQLTGHSQSGKWSAADNLAHLDR